MEYYSWILWIVSVIANLIVLLNFLIAIISTAYDMTMTGANTIIYEGRSDVNYEITLLVQYYNKWMNNKKEAQVFTLVSNVEQAS